MRNNVAFKTRSPKLISLSILFLSLDAIGSTLYYSSDSTSAHWNQKCTIDIFVSQVLYLGVAVIYFIRMFRIFKVYKSYNNYLEQQVEAERKE